MPRPVGIPSSSTSEHSELHQRTRFLITNEVKSFRARQHASAGFRSQAESMEDFPDGSFANRRPPLIPNERRELDASVFDRLEQLHVLGDILVVPTARAIHVYKSGDGKADVFEGWKYGRIASLTLSETSRYIWVGTSSGELYEVDTTSMRCVFIRQGIHRRSVDHIFKYGSDMITIDKSGSLVHWKPNAITHDLVSVNTPIYDQFSVLPGWVWVGKLDSRFWFFYPENSTESSLSKGQGVLRVYDFRSSAGGVRGQPLEVNVDIPGVGRVTSGAVVPAKLGVVFLGHRTGHVTVWDSAKLTLLLVQKVSTERITALVGPSRFLWVGFDTGFIEVLDVTTPWRVIKRWAAHEGTVVRLFLDPASLWDASALRVVSAGNNCTICFWDGFLRKDWMAGALQQREPAFCVARDLRVNIFSWNVDGQNPQKLWDPAGPGGNQTLLSDFLSSLDQPDLIHFGFQEMIDLSSKTLALRTILFATDRRDVTGRYREWRNMLKKAVLDFLGPDYVLVSHCHLVGIASDLFARRVIADRIKDLAVTTVKTGFDSSYGNKGSILTRFVLEDSSFCFINSHLTSGQKKPMERTRDIIEIMENARFPRPSSSSTRLAYVFRGDGTQVSDQELVFYCGDLNFRVELPREQVLAFITQGKLRDMLPYDQLVLEMQSNPSFALRSFREPELNFAPTYKYDHLSDSYDTSQKQRVPSWCDRILFRSEPAYKITPVPQGYRRYEASLSDHRPISASFFAQVKSVEADLHDSARREVVREWAKAKETLLETARSYYPVY